VRECNTDDASKSRNVFFSLSLCGGVELVGFEELFLNA